MSGIKNIVFDIGMVLVDFLWMDKMRELGYSDEKIEYLRGKLVEESTWVEFDRGVWSEQEVFSHMRQLAQDCPEAVDEFFGDMRGLIRSYDSTADWLKGLKERGYRIYLLTNYPKRMFLLHSGVTQEQLAQESLIRTKKLANPEYLVGDVSQYLEVGESASLVMKSDETDRQDQFTFMQYVDGYIVSAYAGYTKPDPRIYQCLMERYGLHAEECVFLDDREVNVQAAVQLGMQGITVHNQVQAAEDLETILSAK